VGIYTSKIYCISTSTTAKQTTLQIIRKYFSLHLHFPYLKMFHLQVRSELYIIWQYFCSMSIFVLFKKKNGIQFENEVRQGLTGYTQTYI
jgi:hypothetical protein